MSFQDVADFLSTWVLCFVVVIFIHILASWLPRRPVTGPVRAVLDFCDETAEPYLAIFRSFIKPFRTGPAQIDLSPIIAIAVLLLVSRFVIQGGVARL